MDAEHYSEEKRRAGRASAAKRGHEGSVEIGQRGGAIVRQRMEDGRRWQFWEKVALECGEDLESFLEGVFEIEGSETA